MVKLVPFSKRFQNFVFVGFNCIAEELKYYKCVCKKQLEVLTSTYHNFSRDMSYSDDHLWSEMVRLNHTFIHKLDRFYEMASSSHTLGIFLRRSLSISMLKDVFMVFSFLFGMIQKMNNTIQKRIGIVVNRKIIMDIVENNFKMRMGILINQYFRERNCRYSDTKDSKEIIAETFDCIREHCNLLETKWNNEKAKRNQDKMQRKQEKLQREQEKRQRKQERMQQSEVQHSATPSPYLPPPISVPTNIPAPKSLSPSAPPASASGSSSDFASTSKGVMKGSHNEISSIPPTVIETPSAPPLDISQVSFQQQRQQVFYVEECPICMEALEVGNRTTLLCGHLIHDSCLKEWKAYKKTCPMCRKSI